MIQRIIYNLIIVASFFICDCQAGLDKEVAESLKCIRAFPYYEKRHSIPIDTLHSIALKETGKAHTQHKIRMVWPWSVNVEGKGHYFDTKHEAISFVKKQILQGKESIDIGCMQINMKHHPKAFRSLEHAFDPKSNVAYGAGFLKSKYDQHGCWHKAIAHYHSATHDLGFKYKQDVIKIASNMNNYKDSLKKHLYNSSDSRKVAYNGFQPQSNRRFNRSFNYYQNNATPSPSTEQKEPFEVKKIRRLSQNRIRSNMMVPVH